MPSAEWDDDDPENPPPPKPGGFDLNCWFNVEPMRPDKFGKQGAMIWTQAARDQSVKHEAEADVRQEAAGYGMLNRPMGEVG